MHVFQKCVISKLEILIYMYTHMNIIYLLYIAQMHQILFPETVWFFTKAERDYLSHLYICMYICVLKWQLRDLKQGNDLCNFLVQYICVYYIFFTEIWEIQIRRWMFYSSTYTLTHVYLHTYSTYALYMYVCSKLLVNASI